MPLALPKVPDQEVGGRACLGVQLVARHVIEGQDPIAPACTLLDGDKALQLVTARGAAEISWREDGNEHQRLIDELVQPFLPMFTDMDVVRVEGHVDVFTG